MPRHHRKPKAMDGSDHPNNISTVSKVKHRAYHSLFKHGNPHHVADVLNKVWIDPEYKLTVIRR